MCSACSKVNASCTWLKMPFAEGATLLTLVDIGCMTQVAGPNVRSPSTCTTAPGPMSTAVEPAIDKCIGTTWSIEDTATAQRPSQLLPPIQLRQWHKFSSPEAPPY